MRCLVSDIRSETPDTQTFRFDVQLDFKPGQAIALEIPGDPKKRFYSLSSSPTEKGSLAITIKADDKTRPLFGSLFTLKPGSAVDIEGPVGSFTLPDILEGPYFFLAGGSGVTPFRSMIKYIQDTQPATEVWLFHSAKDPEDLIFKEEFMIWSKNSLFHYIPTFTRWDSPDQKAETGRIGEALLKRHLPLMKGMFFICGPSAFVSNMEHILTAQQVPPAHIQERAMGTVKSRTRTLTFAHSPDPDDAFMFYGFASGAVTLPDHIVKPHLEDIQTLNERALKGEFEITAVSAHAYAYCSALYWVLSCGASVGRGYGPILVKRRDSKIENRELKIATPGKWTTASLIFDLWLAQNPNFKCTKMLLPFDQILPALKRGEIDAGLIIHEGQLTYAEQGLEKIWDAGQWWKKTTGLPLPLGLAVVRSDLGMALAHEIDTAFRKSILYALDHPKEATAYALQYGRGLDPALGKRFIGMYVNQDTLAQGKEVQQGLEELYKRAHTAGLIPTQPDLTFI